MDTHLAKSAELNDEIVALKAGGMTAANDLAIRRALEAAGIEFISEKIGVRLRAPRNQNET
jgi:hypothetical protein